MTMIIEGPRGEPNATAADGSSSMHLAAEKGAGDSLDGFLRKLKNTSNNTKKQDELLSKFLESEALVRRYCERASDCREFFDYLDETIETIDDLDSSALSLNADETNTRSFLACIERVVVCYRTELKKLEQNQLILSNKSEIKASVAQICAKLMDARYLSLVKKCLQMKSTAKSKNVVALQEMCVRILTLLVQESSDAAKKLAVEFDYFGQHKNWLEKCLLMKQSNLREHCVYFLMSFFKYVKPRSTSEAHASSRPSQEPPAAGTGGKAFVGDLEYLAVIKKMFLSGPAAETATTSGESGAKPGREKLPQPASSSLVYCLFLHLHVDSWAAIEFLLQEILFKLVRNDAFTKSEKVRFFNEKTLTALVKLFEWRDSLANKLERPASHARYFDSPAAGDEDEDRTLYVREMVAEFLKVLFCSTRHGISFYDRTLSLDQQSAKNHNHLIFNAIIGLQRPITFTSEHAADAEKAALAMNPKMAKLNEINMRTNKFIDELFLKTLRVCPDLIQRFLKVRCKQEANNNSKDKDKSQDGWFIRFCVQLFESQLAVIRSMRKNPSGPASYLRSLARADWTMPVIGSRDEDDKDGLRWFVSELIIQTSMPLCVSFPKLLAQSVDSLGGQARYDDVLRLLTTSLKCLYEWKQVLSSICCELRASGQQQHVLRSDDDQNFMIHENLRLLFMQSSQLAARTLEDGIGNFFLKLNLDLLAKYLPRSELFYQKFTEISQKESAVEGGHDAFKKLIGRFLDLFTLYLDFFTDKFEAPSIPGAGGDLHEKDYLSMEAKSSFLNLMQIESFEQTTNKFLAKVLELEDAADSSSSSFDLSLCLKYLEFINNFLTIKQAQDQADESSLSLRLVGEGCDPVELNYRKAASADVGWEVDFGKHELVKNLVRIMARFADEASFKALVGHYLRFVELHLDDEHHVGSLQVRPRDLHDVVYLWLLKMRKKLQRSSSADAAELRAFVGFLYCCLVSFLDGNHRRLLIISMDAERRAQVGLEQLVVHASLRNYFSFVRKFGKSKLARGFLTEFLFSLGLVVRTEEGADASAWTSLAAESLLTELVPDETLLLAGDADGLAKGLLDELRADLRKKIDKMLASTPDEGASEAEKVMQAFEANNFKYETDYYESSGGHRCLYMDSRLRVRHLLLLAHVNLSRPAGEQSAYDLEVALENLKNCLINIHKLFLIHESDSRAEKPAEDKTTTATFLLNLSDYQEIFDLVLADPVLLKHSFGSKTVSSFLKRLWSGLNEHDQLTSASVAKYKSTLRRFFDVYLDVYVKMFHGLRLQIEQQATTATVDTELLSKNNLNLIIKLDFGVEALVGVFSDLFVVLGHFLGRSDEKHARKTLKNVFQFFVGLVAKFQALQADKLAATAGDSLLRVLQQILKTLLSCYSRPELAAELSAETSAQISSFIVSSFKQKPNLVKTIICGYFDEHPELQKTASQLGSLLKDAFGQLDQQAAAAKAARAASSRASGHSDEPKQTDLDSLVKSYTFTMSLRDRRVLNRLRALDPDLKCLIFKSKSEGNLGSQVTMADFQSACLKESMLLETVRNYPISRKIDDLKSEPANADDSDQEGVYDPVYLLPNMFNLLNYANIVDVIKFSQSKCLSFLFASLALECAFLRSLAYACIYRFYLHLENSQAYFKGMVCYLIELLKNSLEIENQKLPNIISVFLAEATLVLIEPGTTLYKPITSFLLLKPTFDLTNAPEFYKLFNSSSLDYKLERKWITDVLIYGCRSSFDYRLYEKRFVFKQLLSIYDSRFSDAELKAAVLRLVEKACRSKYSLVDLVKKHSFLVWLTDVVEKDRHAGTVNLSLFCQKVGIFLQAWQKLKPSHDVAQDDEESTKVEDDEKEKNSNQTWTFLNQMFVLAKVILEIVAKNYKKIVQLDSESKQPDEKMEVDGDESRPPTTLSGRRLFVKKFLTALHEIVLEIKLLGRRTLEKFAKTSTLGANLLCQFRESDFRHLVAINQDQELYRRELFLILVENGFGTNLGRETTTSNWTFLMNFIGSSDLFESAAAEDDQIDSALERFYATLESCLARVDLDSDSTASSDYLGSFIRSSRLTTVTNLNEFCENLAGFAAVRQGSDLAQMQKKLQQLVKTLLGKLAGLSDAELSAEERDLVSSLSLHSKKRSRSNYDLAKEFESSLKKLKRA